MFPMDSVFAPNGMFDMVKSFVTQLSPQSQGHTRGAGGRIHSRYMQRSGSKEPSQLDVLTSKRENSHEVEASLSKKIPLKQTRNQTTKNQQGQSEFKIPMKTTKKQRCRSKKTKKLRSTSVAHLQ